MLASVRIVAALALGSPVGACAPTPPPPPAERVSPAPPAAPGPTEVTGITVLELVTAGARPEDRLPMLVAIHGLGDRPEDFAPLLADFRLPARLIVPRGLDPHGDGFSWFPLRARDGDPEALARGMTAAGDRLARTITELVRTRPTIGRPIVTGFSQGGMLSFVLATAHPQLIAAAFPVGGWLPEPAWPAAGGGPPIVALHGSEDSVVPVAPTRAAVAALAQRGFDVELKEYAGVGHTITAGMRRDLHDLLAEAMP